MKILLIGDIVGKAGVDIVVQCAQILRRKEKLDFIIANGENAESGSGITKAIYRRLIAAGIDGITLGDHIYRKKEIIDVLESERNIVKPANFPPDAPGQTSMVLQSEGGARLGVISLLGRVFMRPVDCPFRAAEREVAAIADQVEAILVDFHAEATSDKQLMGRLLDGKTSAVLGTHTHVTTADEQIFPGGTAFQCDVGMTGPHDSILGRRVDRVMETTLSFRPTSFHVAKEDVKLSGTLVEIDSASGRATRIERISVDEKLAAKWAAETDGENR